MDQYIIIVIPPKEIIAKVNKYKKKYAKYTKYNIPPHITIYPPFFSLLPSEETLIEALIQSLKSKKPSRLNLQKVNFFEGRNNVIYFEPDNDSSKYLLDLVLWVSKSLRNKARNVFKDYNFSPDKFKPHMTIAERIPKNIFVNIRKDLQNIKVNFSFLIDSVYLYRLDNSARVWINISEIRFN